MRRTRRSLLFTTKNKVEVLRGGAEFFRRMVAIIESATYSLHLQTYIFDADETGSPIAQALMAAARRGVLVYVLLDGYATQHLTAEFIAELRNAGVHFSYFEPVLKSRSFYFGRRLHHKVVVADGHACMVSGANVSNRYNDINEVPAWLDWAVYVEGEVARALNKLCTRLWDRSVLRKRCKIDPYKFIKELPADECQVRISRNDWVYKKTDITKTYRELFHRAEKEVTVLTSYFWPPRKLLRTMAAASARGVRIRLILTARADVPFAKQTERYMYPWLFRHKVEVYEYQKNILHGKMAVSDCSFVTAGSYNVNHISAFASVELNLDIDNESVAKEVNERFETLIREDCKRITEKEFAATSNIFKLFFYYLSYRMVHIIFFLFTFYFVQKGADD